MTIASVVALLNDRGLASVFLSWLAWSFRGTVLLFFAWLATIVLRRSAAAVRHLVWASALAGMLLLPAFARVVPAIHVGWLSDVWPNITAPRETPPPPVAPVALPRQSTNAPALVRVVEPRKSIKEVAFNFPSTPRPVIDVGVWVALTWIVGVMALLLRAVAGLFQLSRWARRAETVHDAEWLSLTQRLAREMEIGRPVTLLQSDRACVPMTWGVVYPRILLPLDADAWLGGRRTVVLLHELAHIKRLDTLTQLIAQLSTAVFWFHPGVWFAAKAMRREREHACDDFVLDAGARASDYAHSLLQIARLLVSGAPAAAALAMARKSELEGRLLAILDPRIDRRPVSRIRLAVASVALIGLAIPLAAVSPSHAVPRRVATMRPSVSTVSASIVGDTARKLMSVARSVTPRVAPHVSRRDTLIDPVSPPAAAAPTDVPTPAVVLPPPTMAVEGPTPARLTMLARAARKATPDVETLIAVTRAAAKMTSDHEKAEVLLTVARHYVPDNDLRSAYFDAVLSMHNDYDRTRVLEPVLMRDTLPASASPQLVRIAEAMSSDNNKGSLVLHLALSHPAMTASMRSALISVVAGIHSDYERSRAIAAISRRRDLTPDQALRLIAVAKSMTSSTEKANSLLMIATGRPLDTPELRRAYLNAAETLTSASDYRRAVVRVIE
jgi:beta-lactamase regulating signal transducer with metallopeptidase domain